MATGGVKYSSSASRRFASAASTVSPWLATSTFSACATYQSSSCCTLAVHTRFTAVAPFHTGPAIPGRQSSPDAPRGVLIAFRNAPPIIA